MRNPKHAQGSGLRVQGQRTHSPQPRAQSQAADLLLEIGMEEMPAAYLDSIIVQLRDEMTHLLDEAYIAHGAIESFGTPRRLVVLVKALSASQQLPAEEIRGPSKQTSFSAKGGSASGGDALGEPTPALQGFLKSRGGTLTQTKLVETDKGAYVYLLKPARRAPTTTVLPQLLSQLISRLKTPKMMRWDDSGFRFARPVRWLLVLYGSTAVRVRVGKLTSGRVTWIGGPKRPKAVAVRSLSAYHAALKRDGVILNPRARQQRIEQLVRAAAKKAGGIAAPEMAAHGLLDEVTGLTERPVSLVGRFDPTYLQLPREVLLASMAKHQRVFAVQSTSGKLLPTFVGILDGQPGKPAAVRRVMERILNVRLADAKLFWEQDLRHPLRAADLSGVMFHEKLGSMAKKTDRLQELSAALGSAWGLSSKELAHLRRASELAKSDLVATMVKEFPTLQGVMGKHYALSQGEPREVAEAIGEHYLPLAGESPKTLTGSALAVLDKYDTLASYFAIGIEPTGDQDPFGLRRAAQGIVEIAWEVHKPLPLDALLHALFYAPGFIPPVLSIKPEVKQQVERELGERVKQYLLERLYTFAWPKPVPPRDIIDAVLASQPDNVVDAMDRIVSLTRMGKDRALLKAAKVVERTCNILKGAPSVKEDGVDESLFKEPLERQTWEAYRRCATTVIELTEKKKDYIQATTRYGEALYDVLHEFFEKVMVNDKDEAVRRNRLALMKSINTLYAARIADLSKLALLQEGTV